MTQRYHSLVQVVLASAARCGRGGSCLALMCTMYERFLYKKSEHHVAYKSQLRGPAIVLTDGLQDITTIAVQRIREKLSACANVVVLKVKVSTDVSESPVDQSTYGILAIPARRRSTLVLGYLH